CGGKRIAHVTFNEIGAFLRAGDLLVINTSATLNAALEARRVDGTPLELHLSTHLPGDVWTVELRLPGETGTQPFRDAQAGEVLALPGGGELAVLAPYATDRAHPASVSARLWLATLRLPLPLKSYLEQYGFPIRYSYVPHRWPLDAYQTVFAVEAG